MNNTGAQLINTTLYEDKHLKLEQIDIVLEGEVIGSSWQEKSKGSVKAHYNIPQWYIRHKKLKELI